MLKELFAVFGIGYLGGALPRRKKEPEWVNSAGKRLKCGNHRKAGTNRDPNKRHRRV